MALTKEQFDALEPGDIVWVETGVYTASRLRVMSTTGSGATRTVRGEIIDHSPNQTSGADDNDGTGIGFSARSVVIA